MTTWTALNKRRGELAAAIPQAIAELAQRERDLVFFDGILRRWDRLLKKPIDMAALRKLTYEEEEAWVARREKMNKRREQRHLQRHFARQAIEFKQNELDYLYRQGVEVATKLRELRLAA